MKAIINWIVLIPVMILAVGIELFTALNPTGAENFFGMDANGISEIIIIAVVLLFVLFFVLSLFDRKTSPIHILRHNYPAGVCAVIAAFSLAGSTAATVADALRGANMDFMGTVLAVVSAFAAIALLLVGINHCTASNTKNNIAFIYLALPLWCAVHLLSRFMSHTATPVAMAETMDLVMYVFLAIFFMYAMMVVGLINGKNPVKAAIYWGAPAAVASLVYALTLVGKVLNTEGSGVFDYIEAVTFGFIGLYAVSFIAELSFMSKTKEEQVVLSEEDDTEESDKQSVNDEEIQNDTETVVDNAVETEINESTKKFFDDISSVESEISEAVETIEVEDVKEENTADVRDYGSYFDNEEAEDMYIESEKIAVDTTKKHPVDKSKYPVTGEKTTHQHTFNDDFIVGMDEDFGNDNIKDDKSDDSVVSETIESNENDNLDARLDEIDRLIISIQGSDADKK